MRRRIALIPLAAAVVIGGVLLASRPLALTSAPGSPVAVASQLPSGAIAPTDAGSGPTSSGAAPSPSPSPAPSTAPRSPSIPIPALTPPVDTTRLDLVLRRARERFAIPGMSATVIWSNGTSWTGVAGLADVARKRKVTPDTVFAAASVSKTFTAALILALVDEGRLSLDDRVHDHIAGLSTRKVPKAVTIRMLLDHTSGIYDFFRNPKIDKALLGDRDRTWTAAQAMRYVGAPYFKPGTEWRYSNTNYLLLGLVAESITGRSLATELHRRFIDPLGLDHTTFQGVEPAADSTARSYRFASSAKTAKPIGLTDGSGIVPFTSVVTASGGAGSIASTSRDLAMWARALYGGDVLDPESLALMLGSVNGTRAYKPSVPYGFGIQRVKVAGHVAYGHSGRFIGARSLVRYLPDIGLTVAVVSNTERTDLSTVLANLVKTATPKPEPLASPTPQPSPGTQSSPASSSSPVPAAVPTAG